MAIEIVDFPVKKWVLSIAMLNYQRVQLVFWKFGINRTSTTVEHEGKYMGLSENRVYSQL